MINIALALILIFIAAGLSWYHEFKLEKDLLVASLRTLVQLLALGFILSWIFLNSQIWIVVLAALVMTINAAFHSSSRVKQKHPRLILDNFLSIALTIWPVSYIGTLLLNETIWWKPEVYLPLIGMLLGNSLNGLSLGIDNFSHELKNKREEIYSLLALGGTPKEVSLPVFKRSMFLALTPTLNSMVSMGIVSIPGMMTGQILAGATPMLSAQTQIVLMFLIATTAFFGIWIGLTFSRKRLFNERGQVCF